ncbi:hypothetical protein QNH10_08310 [Sporosarcina thermotolerans]|uniref:hypothetical protein n=1 Tax=Sporosarcina thermotolerans TaxID=633404 RepID=UPI0024BC194D|nr:hypothetical protein [Sporosarcina thermotolerans]WHT49502.1 hypothetical protein QNH10_08310 [Sporosarcina thermotolerans]
MSCEIWKIRYYPPFRASNGPLSNPSGQPGDPGSGISPDITPVYGSLYSNPSYSAASGANVFFDTTGPSKGITLNTADDSITINSSGVYAISFSIIINASEVEGATNSIDFMLSINGTPITNYLLSHQTLIAFKNEIDTLSRTDQFMLNQGDVIRVSIGSVNGTFSYNNAALVITKAG